MDENSDAPGLAQGDAPRGLFDWCAELRDAIQVIKATPEEQRLQQDLAHEAQARVEASSRAVTDLVRFDCYRALQALERLAEAQTEDSRRHAAIRARTMLRSVAFHLGPERVSEREYAAAIDALEVPLREFQRVAKERLALEEALEKRVFGSRSRPRPFELTRAALRFAKGLAWAVSTLKSMWSFSPEGRSLGGTKAERGQPPKTLLAELEGILLTGGFSQREVGTLDFDGQGEALAEQRVRHRAKLLRERAIPDPSTGEVAALEREIGGASK